jgi:hypothetical protein
MVWMDRKKVKEFSGEKMERRKQSVRLWYHLMDGIEHKSSDQHGILNPVESMGYNHRAAANIPDTTLVIFASDTPCKTTTGVVSQDVM